MHRLGWTSLFVLLCSGLVNACEASGDVLTRQVNLGKHLVETRALKEGSSGNGEQGGTLGRVLSSSTHGAPVVFLLGYEPSMKAAVTSALTSMGASILQNLPKSDHWLVRSTPANIHSLQQQFPTVTSSVLPKHAKISDSADRIVREMGQARQASPHVHSKAHPGRVLHGAGGTDGSEPAWLKELKHFRSKDGHTHIVLSVDRPAFTTVKSAYCSECPERAEAKREAEAWAQGMKEGLAAELSQKPGDACNPIIEGYTLIGTLRLIVCLEQAEDALSWLAEQGEVVSVAFEHVLKPMNLHASRAIQSGAFSSPLPDNFASDGTRESLFPHWAAGITGEGQIVGVSDTGIDMGSCYFWDPSFADYQTNSDNIKKTDDSDGVSFEHFANANHRKVVSYFWFRDADKDDDAAGHGTHVAGTVAGSPYNFDPVTSPDLATGVAPRARVSFFDIAEGDLGTIITPGDCVDSSCSGEAKGSETSIFEVQRKEGARIATNSWGTSNYDYSSFCRNLDAWLWENDMLILFSAGNQGVDHDPEGATGKVGSPATCKNVLAIGATGNFFNTSSMPDGGTEDRLIDDNGNQIQVSNITDKFVNNEGLLFYLLDSNGAKTQVNKTYFRDFSYFAWNEEIVSTLGIGQERELMLADPLDACSSLNGDYSNKVVVFDEGGSCSLSTKANNVKATGAVAGILLDSDPTLNTDDTVTGLPFITVFSNPSFFSFYEIFFGLDSGSRYSLVTAGNSPHDYITDFSSYGSSSQDAYILPKLTAPGIMLSAGTDGNYNAAQSQCTPQVSKKQGTSMACPAAAGAAALARQYFMDGFYPTGSKVPENAMEPTASLLTAVLVAGASAMQGLAIRDGSNLQLYDEYEGYGRVNLYRSLPIDGVTSSGWNLQVWQKETLFIAGETKRYNVGATGGSSLILSLAWMDLPATSTGGEPALINDLDLKVTAPDGSVLWGNGRTNGDRANNIEKVVIDSPQSGEYSVEVTAVSIDALEGPQSFSVVALGGVNAAATDKVGPPPPPFPSPPPPSPAPPPPSPSPPPSPPSPPPSPFPPPTPPSPPSPPPSPPQPPSPYPPPPAPLPPPPSPSPSPTLAPNPDEEFTDNERQVDIDFGMALTGDQLEDLRDEASALYQTFRDETTTFLANELGEGSRVTLITLIIPSDVNRRSLLQTVDVTGRYLFQTPEGTSAEETRSRTNTIISRLNEDDGAEYLTSNTNLGSLDIQNIDAQDTTPSSDSGAQRVGGAAVLRAALMAMGAALLLAL